MDKNTIPPHAPPRAVLYERLSAARDDSTSIARQSEQLHARAKQEGWDVVAELVDEGFKD